MSIKSSANSEFSFIENLKTRFSKTKIGDDCAVLPKNKKTDLVVTTDLLVEEIDFRRDWIQPKFLGHKALAISLSDVAAMGATPVWSMLSIGIPASVWKTDFVEKFYEGYLKLAKKFNVELVGGDVSKTPDKIVIDSIVAGEIRKGKAILRSGAKSGDLIFVTGNLGGAAGGLKLLENGLRYDSNNEIWQKKVLRKQLQPFPRISDGKFLSKHNLATSMIDLSDGLSSDLMHICRASNVGAKIFADNIPIDEKISTLATFFDERLDFALNGGEDFELLFTINPKKYFRFKKEFKNRQFSLVGETTANAEHIELIRPEKTSFLKPKGFRHF